MTDTKPHRSVGQWMRVVTTSQSTDARGLSVTLQHTEWLDMDAAVERLHEAMRERPDAGVRNWLDCALNGWGDES